MSGFYGGGPYLPYATTTSDMTLTDYNYVVTCPTDGKIITLPPSNSSNIGRIFIVKAIFSGILISVNPSGTDTIDGVASGVNLADFQSEMFQSNGNGGWFQLSLR